MFFTHFWHAADLPAGILDEGDKNGKAERCCFLKDTVHQLSERK
jgi:hypothetical protein